MGNVPKSPGYLLKQKILLAHSKPSTLESADRIVESLFLKAAPKTNAASLHITNVVHIMLIYVKTIKRPDKIKIWGVPSITSQSTGHHCQSIISQTHHLFKHFSLEVYLLSSPISLHILLSARN